MFKKKALLGIDIDAYHIKAIEKKGKWQFIRWMAEPVPEDMIRQGAAISEEALALFIKGKLKKASIREKKCGVCLSLNHVIIRVFDFPAAVIKSLKDNVRYEIAEYLPLKIDKYIIDYRVLNDISSMQQHFLRVMVVAALRDTVETYIRVLKRAGLKPVMMDVPVNCQERWYNAYISSIGDTSIKKNVCLVDIGMYSVRFTILHGGVYFIDKLSPFLKEQDKEFDIDYLIEEIMEVLNYFYSRKPGDEIHNILVIGCGDLINALPECMEQSLGIPVSLINTLEDHKDGICLYNAIGAAVNQETQAGEGINLITAEKPKKRIFSVIVGVVSAILLILGIGVLGFWIPLQNKYELIRELETLQTQAAQYREVVTDYYDIKNEIEALQEEEQFFNQIISQQVQLSHLVNVIDGCLPSTVHIAEISTDQDMIRIIGRAANDSSVAQLLMKLSDTGEFNKVFIEEIVLEQITGLKLFSLQCNVMIYNDLNQELHAEEKE